MNQNDLFDAVGQVDEALLERSEQPAKRRRPRWIAAVAAVLAAALVGGILLRPEGGTLSALAISVAQYPERPPYPDESADNADAQFDRWWEDGRARRLENGEPEALRPFFAQSMAQLLGTAGGENRLYSPLNLYLALAMLAETTDGSSRQQVLELLGSPDPDALRAQADAIWNAHYEQDGATAIVPASSLWLDDRVNFKQPVLDALSEYCRASSYWGDLDSETMAGAMRQWLSEQTGGLLDGQHSQAAPDPDTLMVLASTLFYRARWLDEFDPALTETGTFHGTAGDRQIDFLRRNLMQTYYYWGAHFGAVALPMDNSGGTMLLLLPDEGCTPEQLLGDEDALDLILTDSLWESWESRSKYLRVNLALPKFDIVSQLELSDSLKQLGVTEVFDPTRSDFSPLTDDTALFLSRVQHDVRVAVDEEGVTAAAYTAMSLAGSAEPPEEEIDFILDRPFLFVILSSQQLPLFAGIVNQP